MNKGMAESWVVYLMTLPKNQKAVTAVCAQGEWDAMEQSRPGFHTLVRTGIANEGEAERIARGAPDHPLPRPRSSMFGKP